MNGLNTSTVKAAQLAETCTNNAVQNYGLHKLKKILNDVILFTFR